MNLKEQQYIVTLAGCGSMTQAAKKLNITQPALSSYLAGVENGPVSYTHLTLPTIA